MPSPSALGATPDSLEPLLAPERLNALAFGAILDRGVAYESNGHVKIASLTPSALFARVAGSAGVSYQVSLSVGSLQPQSRPALVAVCSCPFAASDLGSESFCKHIVSAAISGRRLYAIERERRAILGACAPGAAPGDGRRSGPRI